MSKAAHDKFDHTLRILYQQMSNCKDLRELLIEAMTINNAWYEIRTMMDKIKEMADLMTQNAITTLKMTPNTKEGCNRYVEETRKQFRIAVKLRKEYAEKSKSLRLRAMLFLARAREVPQLTFCTQWHEFTSVVFIVTQHENDPTEECIVKNVQNFKMAASQKYWDEYVRATIKIRQRAARKRTN